MFFNGKFEIITSHLKIKREKNGAANLKVYRYINKNVQQLLENKKALQ
jgi:hypothetical protein